MKLYVKIENTSNEVFKMVVNCGRLIEGLKTVIEKLPKDFTKNKQLASRIYVSEVGFDSEQHTYKDTSLVLKKAGYEFD